MSVLKVCGYFERTIDVDIAVFWLYAYLIITHALIVLGYTCPWRCVLCMYRGVASARKCTYT